MAINTLVTIKDHIQNFVDDHEQLQRVIFDADDQRSQRITEGTLFPVMYVAPISVEIGRAMNTHTLRIYVYERMNNDNSDTWENANDTSLILRDIRLWWNNYSQSDIEILGDPSGTFAVDRELDKLVGYFAEMQFQIPSHGRCDIPINVTPSPSPSCYPASYIVQYEDGTLIEEGNIPSGGSKLIEVPNCPTCEDATWELRDSQGDLLDSGTVASGGSVTITAPDSSYMVEYADGTEIQSGTIPSGGSETIVVPNCPKDLTLIILYSDADDSASITVVADSDGTIDTIVTTLTGLVIEVESVVVTEPFSISEGDKIDFSFDAAIGPGEIKLKGNHV